MGWITPEWVNSWGGALALLASFVLGTAAICLPIWKMLTRNSFRTAGLAAMTLGVVLISSYKWSEVVLELRDVEATISDLKRQDAQQKDQIGRLEADRRQMQIDADEQKARTVELANRVETLQAARADADAQISAMKRTGEEKDANIDELRRSTQNMGQTIAELRATGQAKSKEINSLEANIKKLQAQNLVESRRHLELASSSEAQLESTRARISSLQTQLAQSNRRIQALKKDLQTASQEIARTQENYQELATSSQAELIRTRYQLAELVAQNSALVAGLESLRKRHDTLQGLFRQLQKTGQINAPRLPLLQMR